ncbi:PQQ-dependent sugar dehydrogenase [Rhodococcus aerolatus]
MAATVLALLLAVAPAVVPRLAPVAGAAPALPAGFRLTTTPTGQAPYTLTDATYLADGSALTAGKDGTVTHVPVAGTPRVLAGRVPVVDAGDLGLTSLVAEPAAPGSPTTTVVTTRSAARPGGTDLLLSRWTLAGGAAPTALVDEQVLLRIPSTQDVHGLAGLVVAPDGTLWAAMGDSSPFTRRTDLQLRAQDPATPYGKLLHLTRDGAGVPTNPGYDPAAPSSWASRTYALGFRSPFRVTLDPSSGAPVVGDVGQNLREEVDVVRPGGNYGWPCREGDIATPEYAGDARCATGFDEPALAYPHTAGSSVTGGVFYQGSAYPQAYRGAYVFGDYADQVVWTARFDAAGALVRDREPAGFATGVGGPVRFLVGPGGDVVWADLDAGTLVRLSYVPGNRPPTAVATVTTDPATRTAGFDATGSSDLDGDALTYRWDFGDGTTGSGPTPSHTYPDAAVRTATLTATDPLGATGTTEVTVAPADHAPALQVLGYAPGRTVMVGERVELSATATDVEDGPLDGAVRWTTQLRHCPTAGSCHAHPGESGAGPSFGVTVDDHGDATVLVVTATVTDSAGVSTRREVEATPRLRTLSVTPTRPAAMTIGGAPATSARVVVGSRTSVGAAPLDAAGTAPFTGWSDGGAREHEVTVPDADLALTATYTPAAPAGGAIAARYAADPALRARLGAPVGPETGDDALREQVFQRGRLVATPTTGAVLLDGPLLAEFLRLGGTAVLGAPARDAVAVPGGTSQDLLDGAALVTSPLFGTHLLPAPVAQRLREAGGTGALGVPFVVRTAPDGGTGVWFTSLAGIYAGPGADAHLLPLPFLLPYVLSGAQDGPLGYPTSEVVTGDGPARMTFERGALVADGFLGLGRVVTG